MHLICMLAGRKRNGQINKGQITGCRMRTTPSYCKVLMKMMNHRRVNQVMVKLIRNSQTTSRKVYPEHGPTGTRR